MSFSCQESDLFLIFCTSEAVPCMCYGPYVETCLSAASQMVPNSLQRSHLETFIKSAHFESTGSNAYCDVIPHSKQSKSKKEGLVSITREACRPWDLMPRDRSLFNWVSLSTCFVYTFSGEKK